MTLRLSTDEFNLMRSALEEYRRSLREQARPMVAGYSEPGIELCTRRLLVETLLEDLEVRNVAHEPVDGKVIPMPLRAAA